MYVRGDGNADTGIEHTLLVTEDGVEVLTARLADSPGGPVAMPAKVVPGNAPSEHVPADMVAGLAIGP